MPAKSKKQEIEKEEIVKLSEFETYAKNPFMLSLVVPKRGKIIKVSKENVSLTNIKTGESSESEMAFMAITEKVDKEEFVKIYKKNIQDMFNLSMQGFKIFGYFLSATQISKDIVAFSYKKCMEYTNYKSKNSVNVGLTDLMNNKFIAKSEVPNMYFLNPSFFFNGDRIVLVKEYIKEGSKIKSVFQSTPETEISNSNFYPENVEEV